MRTDKLSFIFVLKYYSGGEIQFPYYIHISKCDLDSNAAVSIAISFPHM